MMTSRVEPAADLRRPHGLRREWAGCRSARLRHHLVLGTQRPAVADARCRRAADLAGERQRRQCHRGRSLFGNRHRPLPARAHRQRLIRHDVAACRGRVVGERFDPGGSRRRQVSSAARSHASRQCRDERLSCRRRHLVRSHRHARQVCGRGERNRPPGPADRSALLRSSAADGEHAAAHGDLRRGFRRSADGALAFGFCRRERHLWRGPRAAGGDQRSAARRQTRSSFRSTAPAAS